MSTTVGGGREGNVSSKHPQLGAVIRVYISTESLGNEHLFNLADMEETTERPKWLLELENRKRKPRLAHEAGAGAPCMTCKDACPGLDLHFWRKICKNCKCSRDDHDIDDNDDFPQFDFLFGPSKKFKRKPTFLRVNDKKPHETGIAFEWVPPDTTEELATDYMKCLPVEKLPITGSAGAILRKQMLQKQLPLHDIDCNARDELSDEERQEFEKYLDNIKKYVGQGKVIKILSARPFDRSLMTPANATDMQRFSPQHKPLTTTNPVQLRTPSSFAPKIPYGKGYNDSQNKLPQIIPSKTTHTQDNNGTKPTVPEKYNLVNSTTNYEISKSEPLTNRHLSGPASLEGHKMSHERTNILDSHLPPLATINADGLNESKASIEQYKDIIRNPSSSISLSKSLSDEAHIAESILADALLPPSTIHTNEIIGSTLDEKKLSFIREKLMNKYSAQENKMPHGPPSICRDLPTSNLQHKDNSMVLKNPSLPQNKEKDRAALIAATKTSAGTVCAPESTKKDVSNIGTKCVDHKKEIIKIDSQIPQSTSTNAASIKSLQMGSPFSHQEVYPNSVEIQDVSNRPGETSAPSCAVYDPVLHSHPPHPAQLSSSCVATNTIHSENLHNQIFPYEPVSSANQPTQEVSNVEDLRGAVEGFTLQTSKPQTCQKCQEEIRVGDVAVTTEKTNSAWHPGCFTCSVCNELLVDLVYFQYKNKLYCGRDLASFLGIPRCFACDELIFVREYTVAEGHNYHVKHFCCWDCDIPLADRHYITENDRPLCLPCYQNTYAKTCKACNIVIAADQQGVSVKDLDFHATEKCFCCSVCKKSLLNSRMTVKYDKLFCSKDCISEFLCAST